MTQRQLPDDLRRFILTSVPSVPYLEAILLLRTDREHGWDVQQVASRLYLGTPRAAELLNSLADAGVGLWVNDPPNALRYHPANPELGAMLDQVTRWYASDLVAVTDLIHSRTEKRAQQFADAFRWKKDA
jgi:Mn-dependent DtxR family transcriptional regulator